MTTVPVLWIDTGPIGAGSRKAKMIPNSIRIHNTYKKHLNLVSLPKRRALTLFKHKHRLRIKVPRRRTMEDLQTDPRKYLFAVQTVEKWNTLPGQTLSSVISSDGQGSKGEPVIKWPAKWLTNRNRPKVKVHTELTLPAVGNTTPAGNQEGRGESQRLRLDVSATRLPGGLDTTLHVSRMYRTSV